MRNIISNLQYYIQSKPSNNQTVEDQKDGTIQALEDNHDLLAVVRNLSSSVNKLVFHNSELIKMSNGKNIGKDLFNFFSSIATKANILNS